MEILASTAIYLASSLTTIQAPNAMPVATVIAASVMQRSVEPAADASPPANPFTLTRNRGGRSLSEAIADVVRRDALQPAISDADSVSSLDTEHDLLEDDRVGEDVTAAHDARIAIISRRMDEARLKGGSAAPLLDSLAVKLRFATAARRLAVAREAIGHIAADCSLELTPARCGVAPALAATDMRAPRRGLAHGPSHRLPASTLNSRADVLVAAAHRPVSGTAHADASRRLASTGEARLAAIRHDPLRRVPGALADQAVRHAGSPQHLVTQGAGRPYLDDAATGSGRARRLLATARRLLEDGAGHVPHRDIKLAGLIHWDGSETWSLANYPPSVA